MTVYNLKLERWLTIVLFSLTVFFVGAVSVGFYAQLQDAVLVRTQNQLLSINILKKRLVEQYLSNQIKEGKDLISYGDTLTESSFLRLTERSKWQDVYFFDSQRIRYSSTESISQWVDSVNQDTSPNTSKFDVLPSGSLFYLIVKDTQVSLLITFDIGSLEEVMTERTGLGATGESYIVTDKGKMLTVSRFFPDSLPYRIQVDTEGFRNAKSGSEGVGVYPDYRGVPIIGAYREVGVTEPDWIILTEIDVAEAMQPVVSIRNRFLWLSLGLLVLSWLVSSWLAKGLSRPILSIQRSISSLVQGKLPKNQLRSSRIREIGSMAESLNELIDALDSTADFAQKIGRGDFSANHHPLSEQDRLGHSLLHMRDRLILLNEQKEQLERETKKVLVSTQEAERERISRDIHDGIGPLLTTTKLKVSTSAIPDSAKQEIVQLINDIIAEIRRISSNLMPAVLSDFGPGEALNQLVRDVQRSTKIDFQYVNDLLPNSRLGKEEGIALYRIAQEAINNTLKHAQATEIVMSLTEFDDQVVFYYKDNGIGFDSQQAYNSRGRGLKNIKERIGILGGTVRIQSSEGTVIEAEIPVV